jgi:arabinofuranan 3-O-arabinosyltransferase
MTMIHRIVVVPRTGHPTDDFTTVWEALHRFVTGAAVYSEDYSTDDPHYLYSPGGTLVLSPLGALSQGLGRNVLIAADAVAVVVALALLTVLVGRRLSGPVWPVALFLVFATESVTNTLLFTNVNGVLLLLEVLFLVLLLAGSRIRWSGVLAGVVLGLAITVKPQFIVLLFLPLVRRQWSVLVTGVAVPVIANVVAWPLLSRPGDYLDIVVPYLGEVRDYANSSIPGIGVHYDMPGGVVVLFQAVAAVAVVVAVLGLLWWRDSAPFLWAATTSGVLLAGVFLVSSLGQMYYSMMLLPLVFTVFCSRSVMHSPVAWLGVYCCMTFDTWDSHLWRDSGEVLEYTRGTVGWGLVVLTAAVAVVVWLRQLRSSGLPVGPSALVRDLLRPAGNTRAPERATTGERVSNQTTARHSRHE